MNPAAAAAAGRAMDMEKTGAAEVAVVVADGSFEFALRVAVSIGLMATSSSLLQDLPAYASVIATAEQADDVRMLHCLHCCNHCFGGSWFC